MFLVNPHYKCNSQQQIYMIIYFCSLLCLCYWKSSVYISIYVVSCQRTVLRYFTVVGYWLWFYILLNTTNIIEVPQKLNQGYSWWLTEAATNIFKLSARIDVPCYNFLCTENYQDQRRCTLRPREVSVVLWNHSPILPTNYKTKPPILVVGHPCM